MARTVASTPDDAAINRPSRHAWAPSCQRARMPAMSRWTAADIPDQTGRTILITGANSGLGLRSAEALAAHGARVLLACRNAEKAAAAHEGVAAVATGPAPEVVPLDLADLDSVA